MRHFVLALSAVVLVAACAAADDAAQGSGADDDVIPIEGVLLDGVSLRAASLAVRLVDGDTLAIGEARVRLAGIDAPELATEPGVFAAGQLALMLRLSAGVVCEQTAVDRWGRAVARCWLKPEMIDLAALQVRYGGALNDARFPPGYSAQEAAAATAGSGLWGCQQVAPPTWAQRRACP